MHTLQRPTFFLLLLVGIRPLAQGVILWVLVSAVMLAVISEGIVK